MKWVLVLALLAAAVLGRRRITRLATRGTGTWVGTYRPRGLDG